MDVTVFGDAERPKEFNMKSRYTLLIMCLLLITGCANNVQYELNSGINTVGFWHGLWHGSILSFSWICSLLNNNIAIYAVYNNGGGYDFGFVLGATSITSTFMYIIRYGIQLVCICFFR